MRLNEIKQVVTGEVNLQEGVIPVHLTMTLEQVVRDGKISNSAQTYVLAALAALFKEGGPYRWPRDINAYEMSTSSEMIETIKAMPGEEVTRLASWLLEALHHPARFEANPFTCACNTNLAPVEWVRWVLRRQD